MPNTPISGLPAPALSDSPNGPAQITALATALDNKVIPKVANQAARDALPASPGLVVFRLDTGDIETYYGGSWSRVAGQLIQAKVWRTTGLSGALTPDTFVTVDFTTSRVSGGFTFDNTNNTITIPQNGHYEVKGRGYMTGGTGYDFDFRIVRQRSSVSNLDMVTSSKGHKAASDDFVYFSDTVPLQTGDKLSMRVTSTTPAGGAANYYGITEVSGVYLFARYVGPLSGATPV